MKSRRVGSRTLGSVIRQHTSTRASESLDESRADDDGCSESRGRERCNSEATEKVEGVVMKGVM